MPVKKHVLYKPGLQKQTAPTAHNARARVRLMQSAYAVVLKKDEGQ